MDQRTAVIDLGTNTFHMLAVELNRIDHSWNQLYKERLFVNLAEEGIHHIGEKAFQRGLDALAHLVGHAKHLGILNFRAVGTAALRHADNAGEFLKQVKSRFGLSVEIISGEREAELISKGVHAALGNLTSPTLILDIGGGSNECILTVDGDVLFARSYPFGIAVLHDLFHKSEPIANSELAALNTFLEEGFKTLKRKTDQFASIMLVGAAGSFEVVETMANRKTRSIPYTRMSIADFRPLFQRILQMDMEERMAIRNVPASRARYLVVAMALIDHMLKMLPSDAFLISDYALKEGIVVECLQTLD